jgi:hypothetical protein
MIVARMTPEINQQQTHVNTSADDPYLPYDFGLVVKNLKVKFFILPRR